MKIFGFNIVRDTEEELQSFVERDSSDGAMSIAASGVGGFFGTSYVDISGAAKNEAELINRYRQMEHHPEVSKAVEDVVNEAIIVATEGNIVDINLDDTEFSQGIKNKIIEEFDNTLKLLDFRNKAFDIFNRYYVDGRIRYHVMIDENKLKEGIQELRFVDPRKLRKVQEISKRRDNQLDMVFKQVKKEYWIYNDRGFINQKTNNSVDHADIKGIKIANDSIIDVNSGILDESNDLILSHLHKAIKAHNQLKMLEDAVVIYRLARAPERRVFYIDVGNLPKAKAEQYLRDMMVKHKNRLSYDAITGEVKDNRRQMTMMEDFWLPRRENGRSTEITTLQGGTNLGEMEDVIYFQKNLYKALNVPISRLETETGFSLGRSSEISRDEIKFAKFIQRLRNKFSNLFNEVLKRQLILKGIMTIEEFEENVSLIQYEFQQDNHFEELKQTEILRERLQSLTEIEQYEGVYYSKEWIRKNILRQSEDDIKELDKEIEKESKESEESEENNPQMNPEPQGQTFQIVPKAPEEPEKKEVSKSNDKKPSQI